MVGLNNKAFSLIELLVIVIIMVILVTVGARFYNDSKKKNYITTAQTELVGVLQYANLTKQVDRWYHQFIYQMGYTPKGILTVIVGTGASNSVPCCSNYPALGTTPCQKSGGSANSYNIGKDENCGVGFICTSGCNFGKCNSSSCTCQGEGAFETYSYYNCKNDSLNKATNNKLICDDSGYNENCDSTQLPASFPAFSKCVTSTWCNCNSFTAGAKSKSFDYEVTLNHENKLCAKE